MKCSSLPLMAMLVIVALAGCNKSNSDTDRKLAELERQNREAVGQKQQLERQLAEQQLAGERDAIERERKRIEDERAALEAAQGAEAAAQQEALAAREQQLARREGNLDGLEVALEDKQQNLEQRDPLLSGRELELAGREPIAEPTPDTTPGESPPVVGYDSFYDSLAAYGAWFETPDYGYAWQPAAACAVGWRPYLDGRWVCTNHGWTWLSNEPFGWACYHYGRWALLRDRGWIWVPGDQWAPAWVCWRGGTKHIGWAPLPPETLDWHNCTWEASVETRFGISTDWFNFVTNDHFSSPIRRHCLPAAQNNDLWPQTTNITHIRCADHNVFVGGPVYQDICRALGRPAPFYQLSLNRRQPPTGDALALRPQVSGHQITLAAPAIHADWNAALRPARVRGALGNTAIDRPEPQAAGPATAWLPSAGRPQQPAQPPAADLLPSLDGRRPERKAAVAPLRPTVPAAASLPPNASLPPDANLREPIAQRLAQAVALQKTPQAELQRQKLLEDAGQRQAEAASQLAQQASVRHQAEAAAQQQAQQAETRRQLAAEEARQGQQEQLQRQQEQAHQRQAEQANLQRAQQAEAQRQHAAEEGRQRLQEDKKKQDEDARQHQRPGR